MEVAVLIEPSGGAHTKALCNAANYSRFLNVRQRIAVAKVVKVNPSVTVIVTDVRRALEHHSQSGNIHISLAMTVRTVVENLENQLKITMSVLAGSTDIDSFYA